MNAYFIPWAGSLGKIIGRRVDMPFLPIPDLVASAKPALEGAGFTLFVLAMLALLGVFASYTELTSRAIDEYLAVLDDAAFGAASEVTPKFISPADPAAFLESFRRLAATPRSAAAR